MVINESNLRSIIREAIINEISQQTKARAIVKANNDMRNMNKMQNNGERTFKKNGRLTDIENEKDRRYRQMQTFAKGLGRDLGGAEVNVSRDGYSISTPKGHVYSNNGGNGIVYQDNSNGNLNRLSKYKDVTDAMMGYDDELTGQMDKDIDSIRRRQKNVQALRDYDDAYNRWKKSDREIKQSQMDYDRQPFFKKWFNKRPSDGSQAPTKPKWEPNENGEFDGYFAHHNPEDYEKDVNTVLNRQKGYKDAKNRYFK